MNNTFPLPQLAAQLAALKNIDVEEAENFISQFFNHIEDTLAVADSVTIKGLGKFIRTDNPDNPVQFIIDKDLAAAVNQPFDIFSPVEIEGDMDLSEDSPTAASSEIVEPIDNSETLESSENSEYSEISEPSDNPISPEPEENAPAPETVEPTVIIQEHYKHNICLYLLFFICGLVIGGILSYVFNRPSATTIENILPVIPYEEVVVDSVIPDNFIESINEMVESEDSAPTIIEPVYDTVTTDCFLTTMARKYYGQMEYWAFIYQANSEILGHPNRIKPGTRVRIPDKSEFTSPGETEEQVLTKAKALGDDIYAKYR